jgi:hypothetical protein
MEGMVILHEIARRCLVSFSKLILKNLRQSELAFLYQMMQEKDMGDELCDWVMKVVRGGRVAR